MTTVTLQPPPAHHFGPADNGVHSGKQTLGIRMTRSMQGLRAKSRESADTQAQSSLRTRSNSSGGSHRAPAAQSTTHTQPQKESRQRPSKSGGFSSFLRKLAGRSASPKHKGDKASTQKTQAQQDALAAAGLVKAPVAKTKTAATTATAGTIGGVTAATVGATLMVEKIVSHNNGTVIDEKPPPSPVAENVAQPPSPVDENAAVHATVHSDNADHSTVESPTLSHGQSLKLPADTPVEAPVTTPASVEGSTTPHVAQVPNQVDNAESQTQTETSATTELATSSESTVESSAPTEVVQPVNDIDNGSALEAGAIGGFVAGIALGAPIAAATRAEQQPTATDPDEVPVAIASRDAASEPIDTSAHVVENDGAAAKETAKEPVVAAEPVHTEESATAAEPAQASTAPFEPVESVEVAASESVVHEATPEAAPAETVAESKEVAEAEITVEETPTTAEPSTEKAASSTNNWPVQFASDPDDAQSADAAIQTAEPKEVRDVEPVEAVKAAESVEAPEPAEQARDVAHITPVEPTKPILPAVVTPQAEKSDLPNTEAAIIQSAASAKEEDFSTPSEEMANPFEDKHSPDKSLSAVAETSPSSVKPLGSAEKAPVDKAVDSSALPLETPAVADPSENETASGDPAQARGVKLAPIVTSVSLPAGAAAPSIASPLSFTARSVSNRSKMEMHSFEGFGIEEDDVVSELSSLAPRSAIGTSPTDTVFSGTSRTTSPVVPARAELPRQNSSTSTVTTGSLASDSKKGGKWRRSMMGLSDALGGKSVSRKTSTRTLPTPTETAPPPVAPRATLHPSQRPYAQATNTSRRASPSPTARVSCQPTLHTNRTIGAGLKDINDAEDLENFFLA